MREAEKTIMIEDLSLPVFRTEVLVAGSGAASLSSALHLKRAGVEDIVIVTDNINGGTSRNTGSDKQTYYKMSDSTLEPDSPYRMAGAMVGGGCMHGDIALVESLGSSKAFYNLVNIGVPFPHNEFGGYTCYKTDHDPAARGTSTGPFTSRIMVERLLEEVRRYGAEILDSHDVVRLLAADGRISGAVVLDKHALSEKSRGLKIILADYLVLGLGGPAGLYEASVYPKVHTGGIGLALEIGAEAVNLTESQFGIASVRHRWNLSGSYQQVIPSYYSTGKNGEGREDFLLPYFDSMRELTEAVFLKGYQWPFDSAKVCGGSSLIDLLVYIEKNIRGRRVFMDFRENPAGQPGWDDFGRDSVSETALEYLDNSDAWALSPFNRLQRLNSDSIDLYRSFGIDPEKEAIEIDVCAQHNNGGLSGDIWWESVNIRNLFPVGEINGSHGINRPGGAALNSGQVGAGRAAERIAGRIRAGRSAGNKSAAEITEGLSTQVSEIVRFVRAVSGGNGTEDPEEFRGEFRHRMSMHGGMVRDRKTIGAAVSEAGRMIAASSEQNAGREERIPLTLKNRHMVIAQFCYLASIEEYLKQGGGSRGSGLVLDPEGSEIHRLLADDWRIRPEDPSMRESIQALRYISGGDDPEGCSVIFEYQRCRELPLQEYWFENVWSEFKSTDGLFNRKDKERK